MALPPGFLDEIRARVPLAQVIGRKVTWDKRKSNPAKGDYWACCPFHQEKTSSFHVEDRKGFYYCFGCQAKGDAITFLKDAENMSFMEAVETLARDAGLEMPAEDPRAAAKEARRAGLVEAMEEAVKFFRLGLRAAKGAEARAYLDRRGLSAETQDQFEIGWAADHRTALRDHLVGKGFDLKTLDEAGLIAIPDDGGQPYDRFRGRVIFPIRDPRGRAIAFGGRSLDPNARAKYLNSPETPLFDKGRTLFNHGPARGAAGKTGALIVAEGYMDVIALAQAGFAHAVAPLGTAITEDQVRLMWRIADEPVVALDGDKAGLRAAMRVIDIALPMLEPGKSLRFALMPEGRDPDDLIRAEGPAAMRALLDKALPMVELLWRRETEDQVLDSPERRAALDARLRAALGKIGDRSLRDHYAQALRERRAKLFAPIAQEVQRRRGDPRSRHFADRALVTPEVKSSALARAALAGESRTSDARWREAGLLYALVRYPGLIDRYFDRIETMEFICRDLDEARGALIAIFLADEDAARVDPLPALEARLGGEIRAKLAANPLAPADGRPGALDSEEAAFEAIEDMLSRHRALMLAAREIAEAEAEIGVSNEEALDQRIAGVMQFVQHEGGLKFRDKDENDDEVYRKRLSAAIEGKIWEKPKRNR